MDKNNKIIKEFIGGLIQEGFHTWDKSKEFSADETYFKFDTPHKRSLFTSIYGPGSYKNRVGDVNIYINSTSDMPNHDESADRLVDKLIWDILEPMGIIKVTGIIDGTSRKNGLLKISMVDCDIRSLVQKRFKTNPQKLLEEIVYLRDTFIQIEGFAEIIAPGIENIRKKYSLIFKPNKQSP